MPEDNQDIHLTPRELEEIKDDVAFKTKTTLTLKHVLKKLEDLNGTHNAIASLRTHRNIHWFLISVIITSLLGLAFVMIKG